MAPSDKPSDADKLNFDALRDALVSRDTPVGGASGENDSGIPLQSEKDSLLSNPDEFLSKIEIQKESSSSLDSNSVRSDTLDFELVSRRARSKYRGIKFMVAGCVLASAGYAAWIHWNEEFFGQNGDEVPIVRASTIPLKVRPAKPGGIEIPNRDILVYDRLERTPPKGVIENLLPRPEVPVTPPAASAPAKTVVSRKLKPRPGTPKTMGSQPTVAEVLAAQKPRPSISMNEVKNRKDGILLVPPPQAKSQGRLKRKALISREKEVQFSNLNSFQVQLLAVRSADAVEKEWARLKRKHINLLGELSLNVTRVDLGKKGVFYRLQTGPFANKGAAKSLCDALTKVKVGCLVVRPNKTR
jgi:hypothetical protein